MDNKTHAKRLGNGWYEYKGFNLDRIDNDNGTVSHWNITRVGELIAHDAANTKADAMRMIDRTENN